MHAEISARPAVVSAAPVMMPTPDRPVDITLRVTAPMHGDCLPIVVLSHGMGASALASHDGYAHRSERGQPPGWPSSNRRTSAPR